MYLLLLYGCFFALMLAVFGLPVDPDCKRDAIELITSKGYPAQSHTVTTDDGYVLGVQRIPHGKELTPGPRPAVLLQHGLLGCAVNWIDNYRPDQSLGFILADAGFDVWLGNIRGSTYSLGHIKFTSKDPDYWKFSWDQMASYDLPAMIDYILGYTNNTQIYYVGHSQGSLIGFAQFSRSEQTAKKVKQFFALAPVGRVGHIEGPLKVLAPYTFPLEMLFELIGFEAFLPTDGILEKMMRYSCSNKADPFQYLCENIVFLLFGHNVVNMNTTRLPVYLCHNPAGTSAQNMAHFGEMVNTNRMQMYSFGRKDNLRYYGQTSPPIYYPEDLKVQTVLFTGGKDQLADPTDVEWLVGRISQSGNLLARYTLDHYHHLNFLWGLDAPQLIYHKIVDHMKNSLV